jgi:hypothetical protein
MSNIHEVEVHRLHPTQITVGMIEVQEKRKMLANLKNHAQRDFLESHPIPAVEGPDNKLYITDHHHLGRALLEQGINTGFFLIEADFSHLTLDAFWPEMDRHKWVHPYDENGILKSFLAIPWHLTYLVDDPYRSVAGYVRNAGGYQKTDAAFSEFLWADFFRSRISPAEINSDFGSAVQKGVVLAHESDAKALPGYVV